MKHIISIALIGTITLVSIGTGAFANPALKGVKRAQATAAATTLGARSGTIAGVQAGRVATGSGSLTRKFEVPSTGSIQKPFNNANTARVYQPPRNDTVGATHSATTKMAAKPGERFQSRQLVSPNGARYKTSQHLDHTGQSLGVVRGTGSGSYLQGNFATRTAK